MLPHHVRPTEKGGWRLIAIRQSVYLLIFIFAQSVPEGVLWQGYVPSWKLFLKPFSLFCIEGLGILGECCLYKMVEREEGRQADMRMKLKKPLEK